MAQAAKHKAASRQQARRTIPSVEGTALVSLQSIAGGDLARIAMALRRAGISGLRPARIILSGRAAARVASGRPVPVQATIVPAQQAESQAGATAQQELARALQAAEARGTALKQDLLAAADMLTSAEMAGRLGMSAEGVRLKRKRHEVIGLELAKRGIRYPAWQILEQQRLLPALPRLFEILGGDPWTIYRFLLQHHPELDGARALDALRDGRTDRVVAVAENIAAAGFA